MQSGFHKYLYMLGAIIFINFSHGTDLSDELERKSNIVLAQTLSEEWFKFETKSFEEFKKVSKTFVDSELSRTDLDAEYKNKFKISAENLTKRRELANLFVKNNNKQLAKWISNNQIETAFTQNFLSMLQFLKERNANYNNNPKGFMPHEESEFMKSHFAGDKSEASIIFNNHQRLTGKRRFETVLEISRLLFNSLETTKKMHLTEYIVCFPELANYFIQPYTLISDHIIKGTQSIELIKKLNMPDKIDSHNLSEGAHEFWQIRENCRVDGPFESFENIQQEALIFMLKLGHKLVMVLPEKDKTSQLVTSEIPGQVIIEMPQSLIFPEEDQGLQPLLSEILEVVTSKMLYPFSHQPKKDLFTQHAQKQKIILKNNDDDDQKKQTNSFKTLVEKKAQKHISNAQGNTQQEYEKIINAITAWAHSGFKPTNGKLTAEEGANWEFEVLHKNKNQKKYGSYAVKSR
jgi:hypothetical protein